MPRGFAAARSWPSVFWTAVTRPSDQSGSTVTSWPRARRSSITARPNLASSVQRPRHEAARVEGRDQVVGVELRRVDRLLQVQPSIDMAEEDVERPLLLLVAAGRSPGEPRLAVAEREARRQGRARPCTRAERRRQPFFEPEHLRAGSQRPAERRNDGGAVQPAAARRGGDHVAPAVDDVEVHRVAARGLTGAGRLPASTSAGSRPMPGLVGRRSVVADQRAARRRCTRARAASRAGRPTSP